jgi:hypothetical protein
MAGRIDALIDKMFDYLNGNEGAESIAEIAEELGISYGYATVVMTILRKNSEYYEWTIPHAKRGPTIPGEKRFHAVLVSRDGTWEIDENAHADARLGAVSTISTIITQQTNERAAFEALKQHTRSLNLRSEYDDLIADFGYLSRKMTRVLDRLRNGTEG